MSDSKVSFDLFPKPSLPPSILSPRIWAGSSYESAATLQKVLKDNHDRWHIFFNDKGFHNHAAHRALTLWAFGASGPVIEAGYKADCGYERRAFESPEPITSKNFYDHLGDQRYYNSYKVFFTEIIQQKDTGAVLEEYVFSLKSNFDSAKDGEAQPEMLNRFLDGLIHPMIHTGLGLEFGLPGMIIEGLAQTAVHGSSSNAIIPISLFKSTASAALDDVASHLASTRLLDATTPASIVPPFKGTHAFTILARILKDPRFTFEQPPEMLHMYQAVMDNYGEALKKYTEEWTVDGADPKDVDEKIEELVWTNALIYGVGGYKQGKPFRNNFFHMHLVTSSLFLPSIVAHLTPASKSSFLRAYFAVCVGWWVSCGRAKLDIAGFFSSTSARPIPLGPFPSPSEKTLPAPTSPDALTPNPWLPIIQTSVVHPDDHLCKLQRALAHWSTLYGLRVAGLPDFSRTELEGADKIDGTLFIRAAGLTIVQMGRVREGEPAADDWNREGFYDY